MSWRRFTDKEPVEKPNATDRLNNILFVGTENDRLKQAGAPSKAIGLLGASQREQGDDNPSLVESLVEIEFVAGYMKNSDGRQVFEQAGSFDDIQGIVVNVNLGCFYSSDKLTPSQTKTLLKEALKKMAIISSNLFVEPLRMKGWFPVAEAVQEKLMSGTLDSNIKIIEFNQGGKLNYETTLRSNAYIPLDKYDIDINRDGDERYAYLMSKDVGDFARLLIDAVIASDYSFGTVCSRGSKIEISLDQKVSDFLERNTSSEVAELVDLFNSRM